jgi:hypothetical protein
MIRKIREKLGENQLQRALKIHVRQKDFLNISEIRSVGIIFDATDPGEFEKIKNYANKLKQAGKRVHGIGFYDAMLIPADLSWSKTDFDLFHRKELQGLSTPSSPYIKTFITEIRDLLIDVNLKNKFPLRYIAAMSYAKCKVGIDLPENAAVHDMLISIDPGQGTDKYLQQVDVYLEMINKK